MVELIESGKKQIVVDLSQATFIDSTTLGVLVGGVKRLRPAGGSLALVCTDDNITKIFEITGLDRVFPIHSSRDEALAAVASSARPLASLSRIARRGPLAQLVEQETLNLKVEGSSPSRPIPLPRRALGRQQFAKERLRGFGVAEEQPRSS